MKKLRIIALACVWLFAVGVMAQKFVHPGLLHSDDDINRIHSLIADRDSVATASYEKLMADPKSSASYKMQGPFDIIARDGAYRSRKTPSENDCLAAYFNALLYAINKDYAHGIKAMGIIRSYADSLKCITGHDAPLCAGLQGFILLNACELMRYSSQADAEMQANGCAWTKQDTKNVERMLKYVFVPILDEFTKTKPYTNGNWGIAMNKLRIAIAVFTEDKKMFREALDYYRGISEFGKIDNGSLPNYLSASGQCQESGRDQAHVMLGLGCLAEVCEVAWHQGTDLYGEAENRLLSGFEYTSKANLGFEVPFEQWKDKTGKYSQWKVIGEGGMGQWRSVFEIAYNHYVGRKCIPMPYTAMALRYVRPEGAGFTCDNPGFGSLLFYRKTPMDVSTAVPGQRLILHSEQRNFDPAVESIIRMRGAENLTIVKTVDCWPEYWDLKPSGSKDGIYDYKPVGTLSRNGFVFDGTKASVKLIVYGDLDVGREVQYCRAQVQRTLRQLKGNMTSQDNTTRTITGIAPYDSVWETKYVSKDADSGLYWKGIQAETGNLSVTEAELSILRNQLRQTGLKTADEAIDNRRDSTLSRNVAWKIWGYAVRYEQDRDAGMLTKAEQAADWYIKNLPYDMVPSWDFNSPANLKVFRDASAACIAASGLLTLSSVMRADTKEMRAKAEGYRTAAIRMLIELSTDRYQSRETKPSFLLHSVGDMQTGSAIDYSLVMTDYYYIEALKKVKL